MSAPRPRPPGCEIGGKGLLSEGQRAANSDAEHRQRERPLTPLSQCPPRGQSAVSPCLVST